MKECVVLVRNEADEHGDCISTYYLPGAHPYTRLVLSGGSRSPHTYNKRVPYVGSFDRENSVAGQEQPILLSVSEILQQQYPFSQPISEKRGWHTVLVKPFPNYGPTSEEHEQLHKSVTSWLNSLRPLHYGVLGEAVQLLGIVHLEDVGDTKRTPADKDRGYHLRSIEVSLYNKVLSCTQAEVQRIAAAVRQMECSKVADRGSIEMKSIAADS
jgi:hypothetical protein